jgi:hypothetical protein
MIRSLDLAHFAKLQAGLESLDHVRHQCLAEPGSLNLTSVTVSTGHISTRSSTKICREPTRTEEAATG